MGRVKVLYALALISVLSCGGDRQSAASVRRRRPQSHLPRHLPSRPRLGSRNRVCGPQIVSVRPTTHQKIPPCQLFASRSPAPWRWPCSTLVRRALV